MRDRQESLRGTRIDICRISTTVVAARDAEQPTLAVLDDAGRVCGTNFRRDTSRGGAPADRRDAPRPSRAARSFQR
jgi:hypothetical protein